tara:strand:+ start:9305 stop:9469 length:165 start_codon:yes stop_codon:yes gene_type:complete
MSKNSPKQNMKALYEWLGTIERKSTDIPKATNKETKAEFYERKGVKGYGNKKSN